MRLEREQQNDRIKTCKRCGKGLTESNGRGRPKEYCTDCEEFIARDRYEKWKGRHA